VEKNLKNTETRNTALVSAKNELTEECMTSQGQIVCGSERDSQLYVGEIKRHQKDFVSDADQEYRQMETGVVPFASKML